MPVKTRDDMADEMRRVVNDANSAARKLKIEGEFFGRTCLAG